MLLGEAVRDLRPGYAEADGVLRSVLDGHSRAQYVHAKARRNHIFELRGQLEKEDLPALPDAKQGEHAALYAAPRAELAARFVHRFDVVGELSLQQRPGVRP